MLMNMFKKLTLTFGFFGAIKVVAAHVFRQRSVKVPLKGFKTSLKFRPYTGDFATIRQVLWYEEYDLNLSSQPEYIVDLGANIGVSSLAFAQKYPGAKVIALEPDKSNFALLEFNTRKCSNLITLNKAVWIKDEMVFLEDPGVKTNSFVFKKTGGSEKENKIPAITLDTLIKEFNISRIDLLKIDIEGVEKEIFLHGDVHWLHKVRYISIEFHNKEVEKKVGELLRGLHFEEGQKGEKKLFKNLRAM
jgi:FkbM family methyltransferase